MKATMPIIRSGAVSPSACAMPMIVPVMMPGIASGSTWWKIACWCDAPTPSAASLIDGGTALSAARDAMMIVGSTSSASTEAADQRRRSRQPEEIEEHRKSEQTEHDRRHGGEIVDVDLDDLGQPVLRRELLEIDRGRDADRKTEDQRHEQRQGRADQRARECRRAPARGCRPR